MRHLGSLAVILLGGSLLAARPLAAALAGDFVAKLVAMDAAATDELGNAVAVSGDLVVVGAPLDDDNGGDSGAAYLFARNQGGADQWGQVAKLLPGDGFASDLFGHAVAISGDTVVVGAPFDDDACPADIFCNSGSAYLFARNQGGAEAWGQVAKLTASDAAAGDEFGNSVAIGNDTVVVGAWRSAASGAFSGSAYVFERNQGGAEMWGEVAELVASDAGTNDTFGIAVGISGDRIVVGALQGDTPFGTNVGSAYVFERNQGGTDAWAEVTEIAATDGAPGDEFGRAVAIADDTIVVGARKDADAGADSGSAYLFARNQGGADGWGQVRKLSASDAAAGDEFGFTVALAGDAVAVGAYRADNDVDAGAVYLFERNRGGADAWGETLRASAFDGAAGDRFGFAVGLSDETLVVGSPRDDDAGDASGAAYLFSRSGSRWEEIEKPVAADPATIDQFGRSVALGGDVAVVGSPAHDQVGVNSGAAYLFERNGGGADAWDQLMELAGSDTTAGDKFGSSVAVNGDTIVVGAVNADTVTAGAGAAYVFERNQGSADGWGEVTILAPAGLGSGDQFGASVAIWGDTIVVGDPADDDACVANPTCESGAAYVFQRNQGGSDSWGLVQKLVASDGAEGDELGTSVAIWGDTVVVGSPFDDDACGSDPCSSGSAYLFARNQGGAGSWGQVEKLVATDDAFDDQLGTSVAIHGDLVAAGALGEGNSAGAVYLFARNQGGADQWGQLDKLTVASPSAGLGRAVSLSGDRLAAGADLDDATCPGAADTVCGAAYLFERNAGGADLWGEVGMLAASDAAADDRFGVAVAMCGPNVLVGAFQDDDGCPGDCDSGSSYLFRLRATEGDLWVTKENGVSEIEPGAEPPYVVEVGNAGAEDVVGATVIDALDPAQFALGRSAWSCAPAAGSAPATSCPASGDAADLAAGVPVDLATGDSVIFTITTQLAGTAVGPITNSARVEARGHLDPSPGNDAATDVDVLLVTGPCGAFVERVLSERVIDTPTEVLACDRVTLGPDLQIVAPGLLMATAGLEFVFVEEVSTGPGAELTLILDSSLQP